MSGLIQRACVASVFALSLLAGGLSAGAQEEEEKKDTLMSERAFKRLSQAHERLGEEDYAGAMEKLDSMLKGMRLSPYENALVLQTYGFIFAQQERYGEAIKYFEDCIALDALPLKAQQGMLYSLAGLYASQQEWLKAVNTIETWLIAEPDPPPDAYILIASSYAELKRYRDALPWIEKAIASSDAAKESWYQLMVAIYFELSEYKSAASTARIMIAKWPEKKNYWEMLQGAYQELGDDVNAMSALELGYQKGVLVDGEQIVNLARMKLYLEVPYWAGALLEKEMQAGRVERNEKNLQLLLGSWEAAREFEKAMIVVDELVVFKDDGKLYLRKAQLYAERNKWPEVVTSADQALNRGGLTQKDRGNALLLKGMAQMEQDLNGPAGETFRQARQLGGKTAEQARSWLQYLDDQAGGNLSAPEAAS